MAIKNTKPFPTNLTLVVHIYPTPKTLSPYKTPNLTNTVDYKNRTLPGHPPHSKLISLLKILKLFQSMPTFFSTLRTHPKIDLNTHTLNPHTFKK